MLDKTVQARRRHSTKRNRNPVLINQSFRRGGQVLLRANGADSESRIVLFWPRYLSFSKNYVIEFWIAEAAKLSHDESIPNLPQISRARSLVFGPRREPLS